jgi:LemA protein
MSILLVIIVVAAVFAVISYNRLVALRQSTKSALADIDVQLKMRHDLVPNLVETVKGYAAHESGVLEAVTAARASAMKPGSPADKSAAEGALTGSLATLMSVAENYPDLKANANFMSLQDQLTDIEAKIAASRRFLNNAVAEYNTAIGQFPGSLFASSFGFAPAEMYALDPTEKAASIDPPKVSFGG